MSGPKPFVWMLAVAGLGTLLWCARGILTSELPGGAGVAAWLLWLIAASALLTLVAYLRELALHHQAVRGGGSWRPVPALLVLWVAGLTALVALPLVLPGGRAEVAPPTSAVTTPTKPTATHDTAGR